MTLNSNDYSVGGVYAKYCNAKFPGDIARFLQEILGPFFNMRVYTDGVHIKAGWDDKPQEPEVHLRDFGWIVLDIASERIMVVSDTELTELDHAMTDAAQKVIDGWIANRMTLKESD